jgi:hypothetical protein
MTFGVTLANRGILLGLTTVPKLLALAGAVKACPLMDSVRAGDALFVNQRVDSLTLLAAIAGRASRVRLGPGHRGSFTLSDRRVFVWEWASLDVISGGRAIQAVCSGGGAGPGLGRGNRRHGHPARQAPRTHDREHRRPAPPLDHRRHPVRGHVSPLRPGDDGAEAAAIHLSDLADHERRPAGERPEGGGRLCVAAGGRVAVA